MKRLIFMRHGKSDWGASCSGDHNRPLAERGRRDARRMGKFLAQAGMAPDSIVTSSAVRAHSTVRLATEAGAWDCPIRVAESLYGASSGRVIEEIRREKDSTRILLVAGHEPTWSETCSLLIGGGGLRCPTAALACIAFDSDGWARIAAGTGQLLWLLPPRLLRSAGFED
ncbi:MAG: histidine phosphatase family protein [Acidobacteriota bacterium]